MVNKTVHAVYAETYDLNTAVGELSILGIHTPQSRNLKKIFHGFFEQYKKFRILGCNIKMVCASQQSLDPSQMGLQAGQVDPRDVLNPILFKACTGEGMNTILDMAYGMGDVIQAGASISQSITSVQDVLNAYYGFLADESFRKSHPQSGLEVMHLVPMVHRVVTTQPLKWNEAKLYSDGDTQNLGDNWQSPGVDTHPTMSVPVSSNNPVHFVSNGLTEMPWLDTAVPFDTGDTADVNGAAYAMVADVPRVYMGCIILPPAILQRLFFRLTVVWHVEFRDFRHATELGYPGTPITDAFGGFGDAGYYNMYHNAIPDSKGMSNEKSSFTTSDKVEVSEVMSKGL